MTIKQGLARLPKTIQTQYRKPREAQAFQDGVEFVVKFLRSLEP